MNTRRGKNQPSSTTRPQTSTGQAKRTRGRSQNPAVNMHTTDDSTSSSPKPSTWKAKSTGTIKITPFNNNSLSTSSTDDSETDTSKNATKSAINQTASPGTARKRISTPQIAPADSSSSVKPSITDVHQSARKTLTFRGTNQNSVVNTSTSDDPSRTAMPQTSTGKTKRLRDSSPDFVENTSTSDDASSSSPKRSPRKAKKSTGTRRITPVNNNSSSASSSPQPSPRIAGKSTAVCRVTPVNNDSSHTKQSLRNSQPDIQSLPSTSADHSQPGPSSHTKQSLRNSQPDIQSLPSTSADHSQPEPSSQRTQKNVSRSPNKGRTKESSVGSQNNTDTDIFAANLDNLVNKCVSFILVADQKKYAIKKQDIIKNVFEHQDVKLYKAVIDKACNILKKTFGLEILAIANRKNEYLLINIIDRDLGTRRFAEYSLIESQKQGLILYLLTLVFMNENVIGEKDLWKALEPLGIDANSRVPHPIFGDVKKYITVELVKQMYLEYKCISKNPIQYEFVWGQRAIQEVGKEELLEFACEVMGNTKPQDWLYQYKDAVASKDLSDG